MHRFRRALKRQVKFIDKEHKTFAVLCFSLLLNSLDLASAKDIFLKKPDIAAVKNRCHQFKESAKKRTLSFQQPQFHVLQETNKKQKLQIKNEIDSTDKQIKPLIKILSRENQTSKDEDID